MRPSPGLRVLAVVTTACALAPSAAHLLEMPHKLALGPDEYLLVQGLYRGWALAGLVWAGTLAMQGFLATGLRRCGHAREARLAALSAGLTILAFVVFLVVTRPVNEATAQWTRLPETGWEALRARWEWSHAANAVLLLAALVAVTRAAVGAVRR